MSMNSSFFDFFDTINNEVESFNRMLDGSRYGYPRRQYVGDDKNADERAISTTKPTDNKVAKNTVATRPRGFFDLDNWFDNDWSLATREPFGSLTVPVDIFDHDKNYELKISVPGVKEKKDINLEYHQNKNQLLVSGNIPSAINDTNKENLKVQERATGKFKRVITLHDYPGVDADNIKADYASGVLTLTVPKLKPEEGKEKGVHRIEISSQDSWSG
ncbi:Uncharacterized protein RNJ44_01377 [Nakaseomyces bracarensis]|uniref:SHSP domain-containing protein n=1 Tax=Nakaseomyces bracarensis TaxID=273131 RepID=A0ABR4NPI8_9SACH